MKVTHTQNVFTAILYTSLPLKFVCGWHKTRGGGN